MWQMTQKANLKWLEIDFYGKYGCIFILNLHIVEWLENQLKDIEILDQLGLLIDKKFYHQESNLCKV
jgi:hypothetical protein